MRCGSFLWLLFTISSSLWARTNAPLDFAPARLAGIINLPGYKRLIIEPASRPRGDAQVILGQGEREREIEVRQIEPDKGRAILTISGSNVLVCCRSQLGLGSDGLLIEDVSLNPLLTIYSMLTQRTLLLHQALPAMRISMHATTTNQVEAAQAIASTLSAKGITSLADGKKFLMILPTSAGNYVTPRSSTINSADSGVSGGRLLPQGSVNFQGAAVEQVLEIYARMKGLKSERSPPLPSTPIVFRPQSDLTMEDFFYAVDTLLRWQRLEIISTKDGLLKLARISERTR